MLKGTNPNLTFMRMCRYIPEHELHSLASAGDVARIRDALIDGTLYLTKKPTNQIEYVWKITNSIFEEALLAHIDSGCRIFKKRVLNPSKDCAIFEANVCLDPDVAVDEAQDVYVEFRVTIDQVFICNCHPHPETSRRLPK